MSLYTDPLTKEEALARLEAALAKMPTALASYYRGCVNIDEPGEGAMWLRQGGCLGLDGAAAFALQDAALALLGYHNVLVAEAVLAAEPPPDPRALEALRRIAALAPRCSEGSCDDNYEEKGEHRLATHETKLFGAPVYLCPEHAANREESHRRAESKGCGKQPAVVPYVEPNEAIKVALEALAEIEGRTAS